MLAALAAPSVVSVRLALCCCADVRNTALLSRHYNNGSPYARTVNGCVGRTDSGRPAAWLGVLVLLHRSLQLCHVMVQELYNCLPFSGTIVLAALAAPAGGLAALLRGSLRDGRVGGWGVKTGRPIRGGLRSFMERGHSSYNGGS